MTPRPEPMCYECGQVILQIPEIVGTSVRHPDTYSCIAALKSALAAERARIDQFTNEPCGHFGCAGTPVIALCVDHFERAKRELPEISDELKDYIMARATVLTVTGILNAERDYFAQRKGIGGSQGV